MDFQINFSIEDLLNFDDLVSISQNDNGRVHRYKLSLSELVNVLNRSTTTQREEMPFLPNNCFKLVKTNLGYEVYADVPKQRWMINFNGNLFEVGFPRLLFRYDCIYQPKKKNYSVEITKIFALKGEEQVNGKTPLFAFPYSHVQSDGQVCMGGNKVKEIANLVELENAHNIFLHSPFGTDWGAKTKLGKSCAELFSVVFNEKDFDEEVLNPVATFNELFALGNE
ncbi:hypothetical protein [Ferdinandcohnia sp. SAFN-114]|uniref:hypothetical protein n=1 Tax=Ferdinandcohnia sp. SAFN-114 TaxID=3387275 RepID=UPI003F813F92